MVVIRLSRGGAKKRPFYQIVVADKRCARDGRCIERIGYFNPIAAGKEIKLLMNYERVKYWLSTGAQPSDRVRQLIKKYAKENPVADATTETQQ
ncbi:MAG TPA: 30S ribosomal protein S16 [Gammaproteobacteria bacterium]|nr:30S ribosomal protein S16 [Gammaproteobacteria bacterium]